jgi:hypothetical protein
VYNRSNTALLWIRSYVPEMPQAAETMPRQGAMFTWNVVCRLARLSLDPKTTHTRSAVPATATWPCRTGGTAVYPCTTAASIHRRTDLLLSVPGRLHDVTDLLVERASVIEQRCQASSRGMVQCGVYMARRDSYLGRVRGHSQETHLQR